MKSAADIEETAAEWLVRREGAAWSDADQTAFDQWVAEETAHRIAVIRLETVWRKAGRLRASALGNGEAVAPPSAAVDDDLPVPRRRRWLWPAAIAASLALVSVPIYQSFNGAESYATAVGGFQRLPLADGSRVDLNTNSRLDVAYSKAVRRLDLEQGEAFFKVAKNAKRPFVVHAGAWRVTAVGTAFTVRMRGGDIDVVVTEGRVRIDPPAASGVAARPVFASAGQVATATGATPVVRPLDAAAIDMAMSWRDGLLIFERKPLGEVAAEFNRYNQVKLVVDPSATGVIVDGSFRATNVAGFLRLLKQGFGVESLPDGRTELVLKKI
ncbi:FecR family protein [Sphingopyxis lindanitolerans]|nr:FecR domain-containing protein [Sphingopyxis lindanitolerans]